MAQYTAVAKRNPGRAAWLVEFRHPLRNDSNGKPGRKIRKGLGTPDDVLAQKLVEELNILLSNDTYWSKGAKGEASLRFDPRVLEIFFSEIETRALQPRQLRDSQLPLPKAEDGYATAVLLGIPGAGKTTILRQLIGTDPSTERFPSTSVNRTTTFPLEVATSRDHFQAVVTFMSEHEVRFEIEESVSAAIIEGVIGDRKQAAQALLEKSDMRFRLKYLLGDFAKQAPEEEDPYDEIEPVEIIDSFFAIAGADAEQMLATVEGVISRIIDLATQLKETVESQNGPLDQLSFEDRNAALDLIEEEAQQDDAFLEIVSDILEEIRLKFTSVTVGEFRKTTSGWPLSWSHNSTEAERNNFLTALKYFSGIAKPSWGRLLTPIVNGMRVFGPFKPAWADTDAKLVLLDTEGLGHKANASADLPEQLLPLLDEADVIVLVDSAKSGMNVAAGKALEGIVNAGYSKKASILFTHMDAVKGDNLKGNAKYEHVFLSLRNVVENQVAKNVSPEAARYLMERLRASSFYVGKIQEADPAPARKELLRLFHHLAEARPLIFIPVGAPVYSDDNLVLAVQKAVIAFRRTWQGYLGLSTLAATKAQPWQRIKALTRRYAEQWDDGFPLRPTSDLTNALSAAFSQFLENPLEWTAEPTAQERREAIDHLKASVTKALPAFTANRLREIPQPQWSAAFSLKGTGSTLTRRNRIEELYQSAVPIPDATGNKAVAILLKELKVIFAEAKEGLEVKAAV